MGFFIKILATIYMVLSTFSIIDRASKQINNSHKPSEDKIAVIIVFGMIVCVFYTIWS